MAAIADDSVFAAASEGDLEAVKAKLEEEGVKLNGKDADGRTALHWAAAGGHIRVCEELVGRGARVETEDATDWTPLISAASAGHASVVDFLIQNGADPEAHNASKRNALSYAAAKGHTDIISLLLAAGVKLNHRDKQKSTALLRAVQADKPAAVAQLLGAEQSVQVNVKNVYGETPLHAACANGNLDLARTLLEAGARADATNDEEETPFDLIPRAQAPMRDTLEALVAELADA